MSDRSNGYEAIAREFISRRSREIGTAVVREWAHALPRRASILDLGCGHGVPISQALIEDGFTVHGIDASPAMIAAFRERFPDAAAECNSVEDSDFFGCTFEGVVAWGLIFLLPAGTQPILIRKVARALKPGGRFLFTSPKEPCTWPDAMTGRQSISLGSAVYREILAAEGLAFVGERWDEGDNHYYFALKT